MKPRVVIFSAFLSPFRSGAEACVEEVATRLCGDYEVTIVTARLRRDLPRRSKLQDPKTKTDSISNVVQVIRVGLGFNFDKWLYPFLAPFAARTIRPALLHAVLESFAGLALLLSRWIVPGAERLLTLQTTNRGFLKGPIVRSAHRVTAISDVLVRQGRQYGADATKIPNGITFALLEKARKKHRKVRGRILFVGRLEKMKGVDTLLAALAQLAIGNWQLAIVGNGSQRSTLEHLAHHLGIADRAIFLGYIPSDRIAKEYAEAEIFCGLSRSEAQGNVFLEAQAAGCAVMATNIGGIPEIVTDGKTGLLVPPNDTQAAAHALRKLLRDTPLRSHLAEAGEAHAKAFDWNLIAPRYAAVYADLLSRTSAAAR